MNTLGSVATCTSAAESPSSNSGIAQLRRPSLRRNISWTLAGNVTYAASQWGILIVIARLGTLEMVGQFSLALAITAPVFIFSQMQSRQVQVTDVNGRFAFADFFGLRLLSICFAFAIVGASAFACGYDSEFSLLLGFVLLAKSFESASDIIHGSLQKYERLDLVAWSLMIKGTVTFVVFSSTLLVTQNLLLATASFTICWAALLVLFDLPVKFHVTGVEPLLSTFDPRQLPEIIRHTLPLGIASGLTSFLANVPRYVLQGFEGEEAVAIYTIAATPLAIITILRNALCMPLLARAARQYQGGYIDAFRGMGRKLVCLEFAGGVGCLLLFALFGDQLLAIVFGKTSDAAYTCLVILGAGFLVSPFAASGLLLYNASHRFWLLAVTSLISLSTLLPMCLWLTPRYGLIGAASATSLRLVFTVPFVLLSGRWILHRRSRELAAEVQVTARAA